MSPLAIIVYENLLPGSQLVNRLQDQGYRVLTCTDPAALVEMAKKEKPMVVVMDLYSKANDLCAIIHRLKEEVATVHVPVLAYSSPQHAGLQSLARESGADLVASDQAILTQLPALLDQALHID